MLPQLLRRCNDSQNLHHTLRALLQSAPRAEHVACDTFLPKLLSDELRVKDAERFIEASS